MLWLSMRIPEMILKRLDGLTVQSAYVWLEHLGRPNESIYLNEKMEYALAIAVRPLTACLNVNQMGPLTFWGGPPNALAFYRGTFKTLVWDRLQNHLILNGKESLLRTLKYQV